MENSNSHAYQTWTKNQHPNKAGLKCPESPVYPQECGLIHPKRLADLLGPNIPAKPKSQPKSQAYFESADTPKTPTAIKNPCRPILNVESWDVTARGIGGAR
jgi:hypothetical protein